MPPHRRPAGRSAGPPHLSEQVLRKWSLIPARPPSTRTKLLDPTKARLSSGHAGSAPGRGAWPRGCTKPPGVRAASTAPHPWRSCLQTGPTRELPRGPTALCAVRRGPLPSHREGGPTAVTTRGCGTRRPGPGTRVQGAAPGLWRPAEAGGGGPQVPGPPPTRRALEAPPPPPGRAPPS